MTIEPEEKIMTNANGVRVGVSMLALTLLSAACGGGGSPSVPTTATSAGTATTTGASTTTTTTVPVASDLIVSLDKSVLTNSGSDQSTLTVTAVDASRNILASVPIAVALDSNATFTPDTGTTTGISGAYTGKIAIGADKSNRLVNYRVTSGSLTKTGAISVTGTVLESSTTPARPLPGDSVTLRIVAKDSAGAGIPGARVAISGIPGVALPTQTTDASGVVSVVFVAPAAGTYPIAIEGSGITNSLSLPVQTSAVGAVASAIGPLSGVSAIATPVVVAANANGSMVNQSEIRALFYAANNVPIQNMRVRFSILGAGLPNERLTNGSNVVVYSDVTGAAKTNYVASTTSSPTNGVVIQACYDLNDFAATVCPNRVQTTLTVASSPVSLTIGADNIISKNSSGIQYIKQFQIQAVDSAGNAKADVPLSAVVDIDGYWKGSTPPAPPTLLTNDIYVASSNGTVALASKWCANEDINRNNVLDAGEDTNKDGSLTPRKSDVALSFVSGVTKTDSSGLALMQLSYPQNLATWLRVKIKVTAGVSGSEGEATYTYVLRAAEEDTANGSFRIPPYGSSLGQPSPSVDADGEGCRTLN